MRIFAGKGAVFAAIALGAFTSFLVWRYVDQATPGQAVIETTPVVVANAPRKLDLGAPIAPAPKKDRGK